MEQLKSKEFFSTARFNRLPVIAKQEGTNGFALYLEQTISEETQCIQMVTMVNSTEKVKNEDGTDKFLTGADGKPEKDEHGNVQYVYKKVVGTRYFGNLATIENTLRQEKIGALNVVFDSVEIISKRANKPMPETTKQALETARTEKKSAKK